MRGKNNTPAQIPHSFSDIKQLVDQVAQGNCRECAIKNDGNGTIEFSATSQDGQERIVVSKTRLPGFEATTNQHCTKTSRAERLKLVQKWSNEGRTQEEMSKLAIVSQKTISNDQKALRVDGRIK